MVCPQAFKDAFRQYGEDGWTTASRDPEYAGQGFPHMMRIVINDLMYGACQAFNMAPSLTHGAAHLIEKFGTKELQKRYVPRMYDGTWSGTMCLTEPNAGSNLATLETTACCSGNGVATITLSRPEKKNAISIELSDEMKRIGMGIYE